jgi:hypothetical protein
MTDAPRFDHLYPDVYIRSPLPPPGATLDENVYVAMRDGVQAMSG